MEQTSFHQENFRRRTRYTAVFLILAAVFCVVTVLNINTGNVHIPVPKILRILFLKEGAATEYNIIWKIRLPRILMAALLGGALSLSGFLLQTFFSNPIAGPFVLGISSGAKMVVALTMIVYLKYIGTEYRINRRNGAIEYATGEEWTDCREYTVVMTIYDFLCCSGQEILPPLTGQWQPVGRFVTAGSSPSTDPFVEKYARAFSGKVEEVKQACICLGGKQMQRLAGADLTFEMPVLPGFSVLLQFWDGDEEFPPKILLLWDKVSLSYLHFETTYYLQGDLLKTILQTIG